MLTRLKVNGFKNLVDVEAWFGPFTCIAGANGVGKSNLFDAILFLSALADKPLMQAAMSVRDEAGRTGDIRSLFHDVGGQYSATMSFEADMIIPEQGLDDLGQEANASATFVRYSVAVRYRDDDSRPSLGPLELTREELSYIKRGETSKHLLFPSSETWREATIRGRRWVPHYISTDDVKGVIRVHQDKGSGGKARELLAASLPRTALSATNAAESPTAMLARREMQSWRLLQMEPSALRQPDEFTAPGRLADNGAHLPAALYHLARENGHPAPANDSTAAYARIANSLATLIDDVRSVRVDRDEKRELLTLFVTGGDGTSHPARALSDGTLRFLALSVLAADPTAHGVLCLEEPENGIHPERIPAMLELLREIASDATATVETGSPLRQVIVNTHSPAVVAQVPDDTLLVAELVDQEDERGRFRSLALRCLDGTWRDRQALVETVSRGTVLSYLNPVPHQQESDGDRPATTRVIDRSDLQPYLFPEMAS